MFLITLGLEKRKTVRDINITSQSVKNNGIFLLKAKIVKFTA